MVQVGEYEVVFLEWPVTLDYLQGDIQQFHLGRCARLVSFGDNPILTVCPLRNVFQPLARLP